MSLRILAALLLGLIISAPNAFAMSRPKCNSVSSPASGNEGVWLVDSTLDGLIGLSPEEVKSSILASMIRVNQQNESGVYFTYRGSASARVRAKKGCGRSCDGVNTIDIEKNVVCDSPGYFARRCQGDTMCLPKDKYHQWAIVLCSKYIESRDPLVVVDTKYVVGDDAYDSGYDVITTMMHELGHAIGMGHPASHINAPGTDQYCDADAAAMGSPYCAYDVNHNYFPERDVHPLAARDFYRYDLVCSEEQVGFRRLKLQQLSESGGSFSLLSSVIDGGVNSASIAHTNNFGVVSVRKGHHRTARMFSTLSSIHQEFSDDDLLRSRRVDSSGAPGVSWAEVRFSSDDNNLANSWHGSPSATSQMGVLGLYSEDVSAVKYCLDVNCLNQKPVVSNVPIEYFDIPGDSRTYGVWTHADRKRGNAAQPYVVHIGEEIDRGELFSENLLMRRVESASKPTIVCNSNSVCSLFYVPLADRLNRIHVMPLARHASNGRFISTLNLGKALISTTIRSDYRTGSDLVSWRRPGVLPGDTVTYLGFVSQDVGFPVKILRLTTGETVATEVWSGGLGVSGLSVSRDVPNDLTTPVRVVWLQP